MLKINSINFSLIWIIMSLNQRFINSITSLYFHQTTFLIKDKKNSLPSAPHNLIGLDDSSFVALETMANREGELTLICSLVQETPSPTKIISFSDQILFRRGSIRILKDLSIWFRRLEPHPYWHHICLEPWNKLTYQCPPVDQSLYINR